MRRVAILFTMATLALAAAAPAARAAGPPAVPGTWAAGVGVDSAGLRAQIDPQGSATTYLFEWTTEASYRMRGFTGASKIPQLGIGIGTGLVQQRLPGLEPATAYRFRVVATNGLGTTVGPERVLTTDEEAPTFSLPDGRGWEMVSPIDKNGGEIQGPGGNLGGGVIQAAAQGGAITYTSASSFAGALSAPGASQYVSTRGGGGWATSNITPPQLSGSYPESPTAGVPYQLFSGDLASALLSNGRRCRTSASTRCPVENPPLPGSGAPAGYRNYFLRSTADGSFRALLQGADIATLALGPEDFEVAFAGATPDLAHIVLSTCAALTAGAIEVPGPEGECDPAEQNLYEKSGAVLSLVNQAPGAALAAQGRAISADGARVYFTAEPASGETDLYLREGAQVRQVDLAQGGGGIFQTASLDGSLAFFTKEGHLYRYVAATGTAVDLTPTGGVEGVLGASDDGTWVYYATASGLYLNHEGAGTRISPQVDPGSWPPSSGSARVSADGRHLLFVSTAELTPYENHSPADGEPQPEVYLFTAPGSAGAGLFCASCDPSGERPIGAASLPGAHPNGTGPFAPDSYRPRVLAADSTHVFFDTYDALVPQDTNHDSDVYEWDAQGTGGCARPLGCVGLISSGRAEGGATFLDASADASDAFFLTDGSLVASDPGAVDVYDARVGGGTTSGEAAIPCFGDACQPLPPEPADPTLGSLRSRHTGNLPPPSKAPRCRKGKVKRQGKCVKKKAHRRKTRHRKAHHKKRDHQKRHHEGRGRR